MPIKNKAVISGATGAIGISLTNKLIENNIETLILCRKNSPRVNDIPKNKLVNIVFCELDEYENFKIESNEKYDVFYHLAWSGTFGEARNDVYLQTKNIKYTLDAVVLANKLGCRSFIGTGSQAEYGRIREKLHADTKINPETAYGSAKYTAGNLSRILCKNLGIKHIWTRILSNYGPYDGENTLISSALKAFLHGSSPDFTLAEQIWDYLYCDDTATALYLAAKNGIDGKTYCVGSGQRKILKEYIEIMRNCVNPDIELKIGKLPYSENQVMYLWADISELTEDTGFIPQVSFKEGIERTIKWIKEKKLA